MVFKFWLRTAGLTEDWIPTGDVSDYAAVIMTLSVILANPKVAWQQDSLGRLYFELFRRFGLDYDNRACQIDIGSTSVFAPQDPHRADVYFADPMDPSKSVIWNPTKYPAVFEAMKGAFSGLSSAFSRLESGHGACQFLGDLFEAAQEMDDQRRYWYKRMDAFQRVTRGIPNPVGIPGVQRSAQSRSKAAPMFRADLLRLYPPSPPTSQADASISESIGQANDTPVIAPRESPRATGTSISSSQVSQLVESQPSQPSVEPVIADRRESPSPTTGTSLSSSQVSAPVQPQPSVEPVIVAPRESPPTTGTSLSSSQVSAPVQSQPSVVVEVHTTRVESLLASSKSPLRPQVLLPSESPPRPQVLLPPESPARPQVLLPLETSGVSTPARKSPVVVDLRQDSIPRSGQVSAIAPGQTQPNSGAVLVPAPSQTQVGLGDAAVLISVPRSTEAQLAKAAVAAPQAPSKAPTPPSKSATVLGSHAAITMDIKPERTLAAASATTVDGAGRDQDRVSSASKRKRDEAAEASSSSKLRKTGNSKSPERSRGRGRPNSPPKARDDSFYGSRARRPRSPLRSRSRDRSDRGPRNRNRTPSPLLSRTRDSRRSRSRSLDRYRRNRSRSPILYDSYRPSRASSYRRWRTPSRSRSRERYRTPPRSPRRSRSPPRRSPPPVRRASLSLKVAEKAPAAPEKAPVPKDKPVETVEKATSTQRKADTTSNGGTGGGAVKDAGTAEGQAVDVVLTGEGAVADGSFERERTLSPPPFAWLGDAEDGMEDMELLEEEENMLCIIE
ncbi:hypothetical protein HK104_002113 [Borealophlyctis nickersoniae]|nr:hypothetical protein HK104_002113 [Borealophlyctis nickersoniae]